MIPQWIVTFLMLSCCSYTAHQEQHTCTSCLLAQFLIFIMEIKDFIEGFDSHYRSLFSILPFFLKLDHQPRLRHCLSGCSISRKVLLSLSSCSNLPAPMKKAIIWIQVIIVWQQQSRRPIRWIRHIPENPDPVVDLFVVPACLLWYETNHKHCCQIF